MNKQRKFMLIAAAIGFIAMFLPWVDIFFISVNGMHGKGILVFLCFLVCGIIAFMGDQTKPLDKSLWMVSLVVSALTAIGMIINYLSASELSGVFGIGYYLALAASLGLAFSVFYFKAAGYNIRDGFDSVKHDISERTKTPDSQKPL